MEQNFQALLGFIIDQSSLTDIQKRIAKEKMNMNVGITIEDFSKSKLEMEKQIASLASYMKSTMGDAITDKEATKWAKQYYNAVANSAKQVVKEQEKINKLAEPKQVYATLNKINKYMAQNSKITDDAKNKLESYKQTLSEGNVTQGMLNDIKVGFAGIETQMRSLGRLGLNWIDKITTAWGKFGVWMISTGIMMKSFQSIKEGVGFVKELADALTNINYTMDVTKSQLEAIGKQSINMGKDLYSSAKNVLGAVKLYANAKSTAEKILQEAKPAIMLSNVTGFSGEQSAKYLQTIMNQFDLTQDELMNVSDIIQNVSQNLAHDFSKTIAA